MKRISVAIIMSLIYCQLAIPAVSAPIKMFDSFGDICCNDEQARLDNFAVSLQQQSDAIGYIIFYGGKMRSGRSCVIANSKLPRRGDAQARAARLKPYLINARSIDTKRVVVIDGGYRESWTAELFIVPKGERPPTPSPTVKRRNVRYRNGRAKKFEYECEV